jgi:hypothetical protein
VVSGRGLAGVLLAAGVGSALLAGVAGGLARVGMVPAALVDAGWLGRAALAHAALMICAFMGTVIGIERAVAARQRFAWTAPFASAASGACILAGAHGAAGLLLSLAGVAFADVNLQLLRRQRGPHTALLLVSALAWLAGNTLFALGASAGAVLPWWFAFLVITIAAERLEMTRLMRRRPGAQPSLQAVLGVMLIGAAASGPWPVAGGLLFGGALAALAGWLVLFDIARRTVRAAGLPRYMAICLLGGYGWLAAGGVCWMAAAAGWPARDAALHAIGLGFLVSMMMGHAPVILPAIARIKLLFGPVFYLPLAALHGSLLLRLLAGGTDLRWRADGALLNAVALALFAATAIGAAFAWRRRYGGRQAIPRTP